MQTHKHSTQRTDSSQTSEAMRSLEALSPAGLALSWTSRAYQTPPHIRHLSRLVAGSLTGTGPRRLVVSIAPRHGKSELLSHWTPVWAFHRNPATRVILTSYEGDAASTWGRRVRNTVAENATRTTTRLADDSTSAARWHTTAGGAMFTAGV